MFKGQLYDIQKEAAQFLCAKKRALLAWEQGTGKTVISIAAADKLLELGYIKNVLIITLPSLVWQWEEKIKDLTTHDVKVALPSRKSTRDYDTDEAHPIFVTSYSLFRKDYDQIASKSWDLVICDEAQQFKNSASKTAKQIKKLNVACKPTYRWALTGTAISNKLEELYSIMYWVDKDFLPAWPAFEKRHIVRSPYTKQIQKYKGLKELSAYLTKKLHRGTQKDLQGKMPELLPPVHHYLDKTKELKNAEHELLSSLDDLVIRINDSNGSISNHDARVTKAFQEVKNLLVSEEKIDYAIALAANILKENPENRVVIFSFHKSPLYELKRTFKQNGIDAFTFTGDETGEEKRQAVQAFKEKSSVLLCSSAGEAGLDLPFANYLIHMDVPFSFASLDQRSKRITRAGSKHKFAVVHYLMIKDSMEEFYYQVVRRKEQLAEATYGKGTQDEVAIKPQSLRQFLDGKSRKEN
jgi:SNF2 family DNA or RNA helicase